MGGLRHMPLALQWAYTNGACAFFATVAMRLPICAGASIRAFEDRNDGYHIAVALADGRYLDAEGLRSRDDLIADFGLDRSTLTETEWTGPAGDDDHADRLMTLMHLHGWDVSPPDGDQGETASSSPKRASRAFDRVGGMCSKPIEVIDRYIRRAA